MALTKIKLNEVDTKADPVLADGVLLSDSADGGRGKISTLTDLQTLIGSGGGGGAVDSVAGKTGVVTLDASDISETAALKIMTADERTKLTGIAEGAEVNTVDSVAGQTGDVTLDADDVAPTASKLWMSDTQASKLSGIAENANNYTHPETHPQSMIEGLADALALKAPLASPALTGTPTAPTAAAGTNTTQLATTAFVTGSLAGKAPLASPALTGTPTAPTPAAGTNTNQIATTAFVQNNDNAWRMITGRKHFDDSGTGNEGMIISRYNIQTVRVNYSIIPSSTTGLSILSIGAPSNKYALLNLENAGVVSATTPAPGTNTTQIATTAFVQDALTGDLLLTEGTPSGPTATGTKGMARFDADYFYVCTATNTWVRFPKDGSWT